MCHNAVMGNVKKCGYCGEPFAPKRSTGKFCSNSHQVLAFKAIKRAAQRSYQSERRSAMSLTFDGRTSGTARCVGKRRTAEPMTGWRTPWYGPMKAIEESPTAAEKAIRSNLGMSIRELQLYLRSIGIKRDPSSLYQEHARIQEEIRGLA